MKNFEVNIAKKLRIKDLNMKTVTMTKPLNDIPTDLVFEKLLGKIFEICEKLEKICEKLTRFFEEICEKLTRFFEEICEKLTRFFEEICEKLVLLLVVSRRHGRKGLVRGLRRHVHKRYRAWRRCAWLVLVVVCLVVIRHPTAYSGVSCY